MLINSSLDAGVVPNCFEHTVVQPLLKKQGLDEGYHSTESALLKASNDILLDTGKNAVLSFSVALGRFSFR